MKKIILSVFVLLLLPLQAYAEGYSIRQNTEVIGAWFVGDTFFENDRKDIVISKNMIKYLDSAKYKKFRVIHEEPTSIYAIAEVHNGEDKLSYSILYFYTDSNPVNELSLSECSVDDVADLYKNFNAAELWEDMNTNDKTLCVTENNPLYVHRKNYWPIVRYYRSKDDAPQ